MNSEDGLNESDRHERMRLETGRLFSERYGRAADWLAAAPGRVNMIGEHVDYNGGLVLPFAIDRYTWVAGGASSGSGGGVRVFSVQQDESFSIAVDRRVERVAEGWTNYVRGVVAMFRELGCELPDLDLLIHSAVPIGGGLSSSAALAVAVATLLESVCKTELGKKEKALLCQRAEHEFAGVPCGIMDPFASVLGQPDSLLYLDCRDETYRHVPFPADELAIVVIDSQVKHSLAAGEYAIRRAECTSAAVKLNVTLLRDVPMDVLLEIEARLERAEFRRARHVVGEIERTRRFVESVEAADCRAAGHLLYESQRSLAEDFDVSCEELDVLVDVARELGEPAGVWGSRMTGGGFGGCTVTLVERDAAPAVLAEILERYQKKSRIEATGFVTRPSAGAYMSG